MFKQGDKVRILESSPSGLVGTIGVIDSVSTSLIEGDAYIVVMPDERGESAYFWYEEQDLEAAE